MNKKMADVDIEPFGKHESRPEEPTDEHIPLDPVPQEYKIGNQHVKRKRLLEEEKAKELNS